MTNQLVFESQEQHSTYHIGSFPDILDHGALTQDLSGYVLTSSSAELAEYLNAMEDVDASLFENITSTQCAVSPLVFTHKEEAIRSSELGALVSVVKHMSEEMSWPRPICHAALVSTEDIGGMVWPHIAPQGRLAYAATNDSLVVILPQVTLPPKNVPLAECFNTSKGNGNDEDSAGALHAGIQAGGGATGARRPEHRSGGQNAGGGRADAVQLGQG